MKNESPFVESPRPSRSMPLSKALACAAMAGMALGTPLFAQSTWSGNGSDNNWSTDENWSGGAAPVSGSGTEIVLAGHTRLTPFVDAPFTMKTMTFGSSTGSFTLTGGLLTFAAAVNPDGNILVNGSNSRQTIENNLKVVQGQIHGGNAGLVLKGGIDIDGSTGVRFMTGTGGALTLDGVISGTITSNFVAFTGNAAGTGEIYVNANNTYKGRTVIWANRVLVSVDALETGGAFGQSTETISVGAANTSASLLTNGAVEIGREIRVASAGTVALGGVTAQTSLFSKNVILGADAGQANGVTLTAASGGRVNFSGNFLRATGATGTADTVTKVGQGIVALVGTNNNYSGVTTVTEGTMLINGKLAGAANGGVVVKAGARLGGTGDGETSGIIERSVVIENGGILSPGDRLENGDRLPGVLTFTNDLTLSETSVTEFDLGTLSDQIVVTGHLTLAGTVNISAGEGFGIGDYKLFDFSEGTFTNNGFQLGDLPSTGGYTYQLDFDQPGSVYLHVIPEPGATALMLGAGIVLCWRIRRRA